METDFNAHNKFNMTDNKLWGLPYIYSNFHNDSQVQQMYSTLKYHHTDQILAFLNNAPKIKDMKCVFSPP